VNRETATAERRRGRTVPPLESVPDDKIPEEKYRNRLLTKAEVQEANPEDECKTLKEFEAEENNG
jgi:hypothetical protein